MTKPEPTDCWRPTMAALPAGPSCAPKLLTRIWTTLGHTFLVSASIDSFIRTSGSGAAVWRGTGCARAADATTSSAIDRAQPPRTYPAERRDGGMIGPVHQS